MAGSLSSNILLLQIFIVIIINTCALVIFINCLVDTLHMLQMEECNGLMSE